MKIAVFGKSFQPEFNIYCQELINELYKSHCQVIVYEPFHHFLSQQINLPDTFNQTFVKTNDLIGVDMVFSIGGDGTFLEAASFVQDLLIPIAGINSGRLGFLADISKDEINQALAKIFNSQFTLRKLNVLEVTTKGDDFGELNFALNELAITKRDSSSMITIHTHLNGEFLNSYWADGLIISTATGSTAYSLSVGGPILHPEAPNFVLSPIAPHNLTVRPLVIPDDMVIQLKVDARGGKFLASLDSRSQVMDEQITITIRKAPFSIQMVLLNHSSYYDTLRNKLMWGVDKRN